MNHRRGFTLVELVIVALLGSLMVMTGYQVLVANQEAHRVRDSRTQVQQSTRAAMDVLFSELREISVRDGDVLAFGADEIQFRAMTTVGAVCSIDTAGPTLPAAMVVRKVHGDFSVGDSVVVFAENDPLTGADDVWVRGLVTGVDTSAVCSDAAGVHYEAAEVALASQAEAFHGKRIRQGALIRAFTRYAYGLTTYGGEQYLSRSESGGRWVPLVGPLAAAPGRSGLRFSYVDHAGGRASNADEIARVDVVLRSRSVVTDAAGEPIVDSLSASIYVRN